jgi:hypothetical protein
MTLPVIGGLVTVLAERVQGVENVACNLILGRALANATGATLDLWGEVLDLPRSTTGPDATDDGVYRALLFGQVVTNTSAGDLESVLTLMRLLGADAVRVTPDYPAGLRMEYRGDLITGDADTMTLLVKATTAVSLTVIETTVHPFGFASDPNAYGFGDGELARSVS